MHRLSKTISDEDGDLTPVARPVRWPATSERESRTPRFSAVESSRATPRHADSGGGRTAWYAAGGGGGGERTAGHHLLHSLSEQDEEFDLRESFNR